MKEKARLLIYNEIKDLEDGFGNHCTEFSIPIRIAEKFREEYGMMTYVAICLLNFLAIMISDDFFEIFEKMNYKDIKRLKKCKGKIGMFVNL